jgi:hypothetical protein
LLAASVKEYKMKWMSIRHRTVLSILGIAVVVLVGAAGARADLLVNLTFDDPGASEGASISSTTNTGTLGGNGSGAGSVTYARNDLAGGNFGADEANVNGLISYTVPGGSLTADYTIMWAARRDGIQDQYDKIMATDNGEFGSFQFDGDGENATWTIASRAQGFSLSDGVWHHFAMSYDHDGGDPKLPGPIPRALVTWYVNGYEIGSNPFVDQQSFASDITPYLLNQSNGTRPMNGAVDSFRLHNTVLDASAIAQAAADALALPPAGTVVSIK